MELIASLWAPITAICAALLAAIFAAGCWRRASELDSVTNRCRARLRELELFASRLELLENRYESLSKAVHLNARRDPVTGKSRAVHAVPAVETKDEARARLGLIGSNAARVAHTIHSQGGLKR